MTNPQLQQLETFDTVPICLKKSISVPVSKQIIMISICLNAFDRVQRMYAHFVSVDFCTTVFPHINDL